MANLPDSYRFLHDDELFRQCLRRAFQGHFLHSPHIVPTDDDIMQFMDEAGDRYHEFREEMAREAAEDTARLQRALNDEEAHEFFFELTEENRESCETNWMLANDDYTLRRLAQLLFVGGPPAASFLGEMD